MHSSTDTLLKNYLLVILQAVTLRIPLILVIFLAVERAHTKLAYSNENGKIPSQTSSITKTSSDCTGTVIVDIYIY